MSRRQRGIIAAALVAVIVAVGAWLGAANPHRAGADSAGCGSGGQLYQVVIQNDRVSPENTDAHLCDRLMFTNRDNTTRNIAFGPHEHHVAYDGVLEKILDENQSFTIILNQAGLFHFHDHFHDEVSGYFSVSK